MTRTGIEFTEEYLQEVIDRYVSNGFDAYTDSKGNIKPYQAARLYAELGLKINENNKAKIATAQ